jgi:hypothetical protein
VRNLLSLLANHFKGRGFKPRRKSQLNGRGFTPEGTGENYFLPFAESACVRASPFSPP